MPLLLLPPAVDSPVTVFRADVSVRVARATSVGASAPGYVQRTRLPDQVDPTEFVPQLGRVRVAVARPGDGSPGRVVRPAIPQTGESDAGTVAPGWRTARAPLLPLSQHARTGRVGVLRPDRPPCGYYIVAGQVVAAGAGAGQVYTAGARAGDVVGGGTAP